MAKDDEKQKDKEKKKKKKAEKLAKKEAKAAKKAAKEAAKAAKKAATSYEKPSWAVNGELALSCSCDVFCPCVVSLGQAKPTEGYCHGWMAVRIDSGHYDGTDLSGLNVGILVDIPGEMGNGDWTAALYIDERADIRQEEGMEKIFSGAAGGTTGLFRLLISTYLGKKKVPISYETDGKTRKISIPRLIEGDITPISGGDKSKDTIIKTQLTGWDLTLSWRSLADRKCVIWPCLEL